MREVIPCSWTRTLQQAGLGQCDVGFLESWEYPVQGGISAEIGEPPWRMV